MYFHLPPNIKWNGEFILGELTRRDIDAAIVGTDIHITLTSRRFQAWKKRYQSNLDRPIAEKRSDRPHLMIRHYPNRTLRNIELIRDVWDTPLSSEQMILAQASLLDFGAILLDSINTEFEIASLLCIQTDDLARFRRRLETLIAVKEKHSNAFEFELAAAALGEEWEVRYELESFLSHGAE